MLLVPQIKGIENEGREKSNTGQYLYPVFNYEIQHVALRLSGNSVKPKTGKGRLPPPPKMHFIFALGQPKATWSVVLLPSHRSCLS
jgi:hypothetical protein